MSLVFYTYSFILRYNIFYFGLVMASSHYWSNEFDRLSSLVRSLSISRSKEIEDKNTVVSYKLQ